MAGYRVEEPLGTGGRVFTLTLIVIGVAALFTALAVLTSLVASGQHLKRGIAIGYLNGGDSHAFQQMPQVLANET